ncbi:competence protein ComEC [Serratia fonticola]|uniref:Competence protein ComEC n=1 Tax=Serratia fonticola TaxID=47917 RepID=A0A559TD41_SERFO|nr:ComEC family protein [Serratia fonticola]TQI79931.1 competence protein ComEC [Serratia fonticola]TQI98043.1 competence protein ComEC [Serratia fonticola]TVZ72538.1 competence protein ComEC [Serratia fonticola]
MNQQLRRADIRISIDIAAIAFVMGMLPLLFLPHLPSLPLLAGLALATVLFWWQRQRQWCQSLCCLLAGFLFAVGSASILMQQVNALIAGGDKQVIATVSSVRLAGVETPQVQFRIEQVNGRWLVPALSFIARGPNATLCAGQRWAMKVRLRPVHSSLNEGGFDGQRWAIANRQPLRGYIRSADVLDDTCHWRQRIISYMDNQLASLAQRPVLLALAFGERALMENDRREQLMKTGVAHLMAISGLHISLAAAFAWGLARGVQYLLPARYIGYRLPLAASWLMALGYVWLAGGQPPAMRAFIALSLWFWLRLQGVSCSSWQVWLWCITLLLLCEPMSVLSDSFWLSALAVAALIFWFEWAPIPARFTAFWGWAPLCWLHIQLGMTLLLMPLQFGLFHGVTWTSLPANLWAVPIVSLLSVPLILLAMMLFFVPPLSRWCWQLADLTVTWALWPLPWLEQGWVQMGAMLLQFSVLGWLAVVCWRFRWWRYFPSGCIAVLLVCLLWRERQTDYRWRVDMLDVGHGLAVVVERGGKAIIYDSGNRWQASSVAERFILPFLHWRQISLEHIFISHSHLDHIGGLEVLSAAFPLAHVHTPMENGNHLPCVQGQRWIWHGLTFQILWPPARVDHAGNDDSCVLRIDDGRFSILLTGDIERRAEQALLHQRATLPSTILQVPHHGSKTSSTPPFLRAVAPQLAIASASRYNVWRLPAEKIIKRYQQNHIVWHDTSRSGQLSVFFFDNDWQIKGFREQLNPRWYHQRFGVEGDNE